MKNLYHPKRILGFEAYVAPDDFDRKAQPVDIYDVFERYYRSHRNAKLIYSVPDSSTYSSLGDYNLTAESYRYGYELGGVKYVHDVVGKCFTQNGANIVAGNSYSTIKVINSSLFPSSGIIVIGRIYENNLDYFIYTSKSDVLNELYGVSQTFTYNHGIGGTTNEVRYAINWGSAIKKWVIYNHSTTSPIYAMLGALVGGCTWVYFGDKVASSNFYYTSSVTYIHIHRLDNITHYIYLNHAGNNLTGTLHLSNNATYMGYYSNQHSTLGSSFAGCSKITGILNIPGSIKYLSGSAFIGCSGLTQIILNEGLECIDEYAFNNCTGLNGALTIPNSCKSIDRNAFYNCNKLDTLDLGTGVQTIGNSAFQYCSQLSGTLTLPDTLTTIGILAFYGCTSFTGTLTIPANITSIGQGAFGDDNFSDIDVTANSGYEDVDDVLYEISTRTALHSVKGDTGTITFQSNTLIIGDYCCLRNQRTGTLTVPDSVTRVGIYAFYDCDGFTAISLETTSSALAMIDDYAFSHCSNLAGTLTLPNSVTLVDAGAFRDDVLITGIVFSSALVTIGADAFRQMTAISENLVLPNSVETIGANAFYNNTARTGTLTLGTGLKTIGGLAFYNTPLTGTLSIPSLVTAIGEAAFSNNNFSAVSSAATGFTVSDYVLYDETVSGQIKAHTSARGYAGTLTLKTGITSILYMCFYNNNNRSGAIVIPYTVTLIRQQAFDDCSGFNSTATIGDTTNGSALASIEAYAFRGCANITGWNIYRTPAPTCNNSFSGYAKPLHIKVGATGYDVTPATAAAPWTNTAIFSSVTADL